MSLVITQSAALGICYENCIICYPRLLFGLKRFSLQSRHYKNSFVSKMYCYLWCKFELIKAVSKIINEVERKAHVHSAYADNVTLVLAAELSASTAG